MIDTKFVGQDSSGVLKSGEKYTLQATVLIKKDAEYVMIEVPIPASCSYDEKTNRNTNEVYREYFKEKVAIFCKQLQGGWYFFNIDVIPRYTGEYTLNPASVELMYFPVFKANNEIKKLKIR
jgi:uncharacterized protein YfaS (alpha-2-macroglobulin family)